MKGGSMSINLLCNEHQSSINHDQFNKFEFEYEDDYFKNLILKELNFDSSSSSSSSDSGSDPFVLTGSRVDSVRWILNTQSLLKYGNQTVYLSVSYLDQFLSVRRIDEDKLWAMRLLSVACLSIAAKMEEYKVASLTEYPVSEFGFDSESIKRMELLVLSTFNWKMSLVTPLAYLHFFVKKFGDQGVRQDCLFSEAVELVMALMKEIRLTEYRPSVVAASAVLAASDWQMTQETLKLKFNSISIWDTSNTNEQEKQLFSCYSLMQRLSTKGNTSTPILTELQQNPDESPSLVGSKRRLDFSNSDQNPNKARRD